ncbi:MAG: Glu-tRNA(Gln) amidotransferase subunit GatD [Candidatus Pacearchaeota archaeon]
MEINLSPGQIVELKTKKGNFKCVILDSPSKDIILIKLPSGYNIGIREEDILDVKILKESNIKEEIGKIKEKNLQIKTKNKSLQKIALIVCGGTISAKLDYKTGAVHWLTNTNELLNFYPEILEIADISKIEVPFMKASEDIDSKDWTKISKNIENLINQPEIKGIIVTHGTDFLHYTSSALAFSLGKLNKPVVLTYSQRSSDRASSDARLNLKCAARVAISDIAEVVLVGHANSDDDFCYVIKGTKVRKMHTSRRDAFRPINSKPLAKVFSDRIEVIDSYNPRNEKLKVSANSKFSDKVALVKFYPGQKPDILNYYINKKYEGIIFEVSGLGHVSTKESRQNMVAKIKKAVKSGIVICAAPQTIYGKLDPYVYSNGRELLDAGVIFLNDILSETAFVKLSWVLANKKMKKNVKENMLKNFNGEFSKFLTKDEFLN